MRPTAEDLRHYFHDVENSTNKTTVDTLHWSAFNIPGTAKSLPEGLGAGVLPDGTTNGPGISARGGNPGSYFGPGAGPARSITTCSNSTRSIQAGSAGHHDARRSAEGDGRPCHR